jgi:hypothetical protein
MSFLKSLTLAIIATAFLTYVLGTSLIEMLDIDLYMGDKLIEPLKAISVSALVVCLLVVAGLAIVLSVFGSIIFIGLLGVGAAIMLMIGVFWPIFLIAIAIWLLARDSSPKEVVYR